MYPELKFNSVISIPLMDGVFTASGTKPDSWLTVMGKTKILSSNCWRAKKENIKNSTLYSRSLRAHNI